MLPANGKNRAFHSDREEMRGMRVSGHQRRIAKANLVAAYFGRKMWTKTRKLEFSRGGVSSEILDPTHPSLWGFGEKQPDSRGWHRRIISLVAHGGEGESGTVGRNRGRGGLKMFVFITLLSRLE